MTFFKKRVKLDEKPEMIDILIMILKLIIQIQIQIHAASEGRQNCLLT